MEHNMTQMGLSEEWGALTSPIYSVLDEYGVNVGYGQVRERADGTWIYVDDVNGWDVLELGDIECWDRLGQLKAAE